MKIAYLDQNAASYLAFGNSNPNWKVIRIALEEAFQENRLVCPMPLETLIESAPCKRDERIALEEFFRGVSGGSRFRHYFEILIDFTMALIRPNHQAVAFGMIGSGWAAMDDAARISKQAHAEAREQMAFRMQNYINPPNAATMSFEEIFSDTCAGRSHMFASDLAKFVETPMIPHSQYSVPWLMAGLIRLGLTPLDVKALSDAVRCHRWEGIFVNFFDLLLGSRWEHDMLHRQRPNYSPNDEIDRWRAAVALGHSDIFITDSYTADLCKRAKIAKYTSTVVLSTKQTAEILSSIENFRRLE